MIITVAIECGAISNFLRQPSFLMIAGSSFSLLFKTTATMLLSVFLKATVSSASLYELEEITFAPAFTNLL